MPHRGALTYPGDGAGGLRSMSNVTQEEPPRSVQRCLRFRCNVVGGLASQNDLHTARKLADALKRRGVAETVLDEAMAEIARGS